MSDENNTRPLPFEIKTAILQLIGLTLSTPKDVADIHFEYSGMWDKLEIRVYVGGYDNKVNATSQVSCDVWISHQSAEETVNKLTKLIDDVNAATLDGRKVKAKRIRDEIAALTAKAEALEHAHTLSATQP